MPPIPVTSPTLRSRLLFLDGTCQQRKCFWLFTFRRKPKCLHMVLAACLRGFATVCRFFRIPGFQWQAFHDTPGLAVTAWPEAEVVPVTAAAEGPSLVVRLQIRQQAVLPWVVQATPLRRGPAQRAAPTRQAFPLW